MSGEEPELLGDAAEFEALLDFLKQTRWFDFTGYKRQSLMRRINRRMQQLRVENYPDYIEYLEVHPGEFPELLNTILINVTGFFRDAPAWRALEEAGLPYLLAAKPGADPIRVWSAGCATGQEAYSVLIMLAEKLGVGEVKNRVKVYATDVDEEALEKARSAVFTPKEVEDLPAEILAKYFDRTPDGFAFSPELRRCVIYGRHDLVQDAPISRVDILLCRNVLMYFNVETQARLLGRLHFALADNGVMLMGKVEMLLGQGDLFRPLDLKNRLFAKVPRASLRSRLLAMMGTVPELPVARDVSGDRLVDLTFEAQPAAQILLDSAGVVVTANRVARDLFGLPLDDVGRPFQDLEISYRPVELRSWIDQALGERGTQRLRDVERYSADGQVSYLDIDIAPLVSEELLAGVVITFRDVTDHHRLQEELEHTHRDLETAYEELQSTNEELETTNEELQSTVEELETTNEELQSTNEELETMNEELQSTNDELQVINDELRERTTQLDDVNAFLESILTSLGGGVIVVDKDLRIRVWNAQAQNLWGIRADEAESRHLLSLEIGLPLEELAGPLRHILKGESPVEHLDVDAVNRRGQSFTCALQCTRLLNAADEVEGAIVVMKVVEDG